MINGISGEVITMIKQFHKLSQRVLLLPPVYIRIEHKLVHIRMAVANIRRYARMSLEEKRSEWLERIHKSRQMIKDRPDNLWLVYELCKDIYELAEIDRVDFNAATLADKSALITLIVPFAELEALQEGVTEYHLSRERENWTMHYLTRGVNEHAETIEK